MKARLLFEAREALAEGRFVEIVIWEVPKPVRGSAHSFKYRLACVVDDVCLVRYDNEAGKGDHKHLGGREVSYVFTTPDRLVEDFWADVARL